MVQRLHLAHAILVLAVTLLSCWCFRKRVLLRCDGAYYNKHLFLWLTTCATWVLYYLAKWTGRVDISAGSATLPVFCDLLFNFTNSILVLTTAISLNARRITVRVSLGVVARRALFYWVVLFAGSLVSGSLLKILGWPDEELVVLAAVAVSVIGASALVLLVHRLVIARHLAQNPQDRKSPSRFIGACVLCFSTYAYLQAYYPFFVVQLGPNKHPEWFAFLLYISAAFLKSACIIVVFAAAPCAADLEGASANSGQVMAGAQSEKR